MNYDIIIITTITINKIKTQTKMKISNFNHHDNLLHMLVLNLELVGHYVMHHGTLISSR